MCLSTAYIDADEQRVEVMDEVAMLQAADGGFWLTTLLGERKFVEGKVKSVDFIEEHTIIFEK